MGGGCLQGNGISPRKPSPGVKETTQGRARQGEQEQRPHLAQSPRGWPEAAAAKRYKRQISLRVGNGGQNEGGKKGRHGGSGIGSTQGECHPKSIAETQKAKGRQDIKDSTARAQSKSSE